MSQQDPETRSGRLSVSIEYADPTLLGFGDDEGIPELVQGCGQILLASSADMARTRMVLTGDFVQSVKDRGEPGSAYHENYDIRRNTGAVAGKTIERPDGTIDVLLPAHWFAADLEGSDLRLAVELALRTTMHEAQHVVISQLNENNTDFSGEEWARQNFLTAADQVIEEYRAEAVACRFAVNDWNTDGLHDQLTTWLEDLRRIALTEYQSHLDVSRLSYDILQETHTVWKLLAYLVAELDATDSDIEQSVVESDLWKRMVEPHWGDFIGLLHRVPDGETRVDRSELDALTAELADVLHDWLVTLGFEFADTPEGNAFWIVDWSLLIETPTRSVCWARRTTDGHVRLCRGQESRP